MLVSTASTADAEERVVELADHVGAGEDEDLVAALEVGAAEVVGGEVGALQPGAEGAVEHEDALAQRVEEVDIATRLPEGAPRRSARPVSGPDRGVDAHRVVGPGEQLVVAALSP